MLFGNLLNTEIPFSYYGQTYSIQNVKINTRVVISLTNHCMMNYVSIVTRVYTY